MAHEPRTSTTAPASCGDHAQPGVTQVPGALDWSHQATTPDQACIEAVLETVLVPGASILHVGVGNSQFAHRFATRASRIDGLTLHPNEQTHAATLALPHYTVYLLNKYSPAFRAVLSHHYAWIIDNNPAHFACCHYHFWLMWKNYLRALIPQGQVVTCQRGMNAYQADCGWVMTYGDLLRLEERFSVQVAPLSDGVYVVQRSATKPVRRRQVTS
jgi:hypothetical protein